eukprot:3106437-Alexandrium_andersonii.AAC.1
MSARLVGSEMCIRDRTSLCHALARSLPRARACTCSRVRHLPSVTAGTRFKHSQTPSESCWSETRKGQHKTPTGPRCPETMP